ncbi:helix-turn-helix domain-containing protein [bacterium]|nr:helix-turn-helix domain-containing protein [bacterium]
MDGKINRIKVMLVDKGKTNRWLATQLGKDPATVSKWCTNSAQPTLETMMQIAKLLNVEMNDLVRFEALPEIPTQEETNENIQQNE